MLDERYGHKISTPQDAVRAIPPGRRILIGSGAAEPNVLVDAMVKHGDHLTDNDVVHLMTMGQAPYVAPGLERRFRHTAFFIGANTRSAVQEGRADTLLGRFFSGIGGQVDFIRGAARSVGGKPIIALSSTAKDGKVSRIQPVVEEGAGIVTSRGDVHYVVTEYGAADLWGKSIRERAMALIEIAHPDHRADLLAAAKKRRADSAGTMARAVLHAGPMDTIAPHVRALIAELFPGAEVTALALLGQPAEAHEASDKACGYGAPLRIDVRMPDGEARRVVLHTATPNEFGHDRRADRAAEALLAFDTMGAIPQHAPVLDAGAVTAGGGLLSLRHAGELYLLTGYAEGSVYAEDLARIARAGELTRRDRDRARLLADYLVGLHAQKRGDAGREVVYRRAVRDLLGSGEGIFGIVDGYPANVPGAPPPRLAAIERHCLEWRWKLRGRHDRLARTHGDFHPFNLVFDEGSNLTLLDASRGCAGDPADDVACLAINYLFFAFDGAGSWPAFRELWYPFWERYLTGSGDGGLLSVVAPFLAWRALVLASPRWYPAFGERPRDKLLSLVERALVADRFDPAWAEGVFA